MSTLDISFEKLKCGTNSYFLIYSNNRSLHKSVRIFPPGTLHNLKRIIIKRCNDFNVYMKSRDQGESIFF